MMTYASSEDAIKKNTTIKHEKSIYGLDNIKKACNLERNWEAV